MTKYAGVCVGGPKAGEQIVHDKPTLEVSHIPPVSMRNRHHGQPTVSHTLYVHGDFFGHGVWCLDRESNGQVMNRLLVLYMAHCAKAERDDF